MKLPNTESDAVIKGPVELEQRLKQRDGCMCIMMPAWEVFVNAYPDQIDASCCMFLPINRLNVSARPDLECSICYADGQCVGASAGELLRWQS